MGSLQVLALPLSNSHLSGKCVSAGEKRGLVKFYLSFTEDARCLTLGKPGVTEVL